MKSPWSSATDEVA